MVHLLFDVIMMARNVLPVDARAAHAYDREDQITGLPP
jgi:hypothetical protein